MVTDKTEQVESEERQEEEQNLQADAEVEESDAEVAETEDTEVSEVEKANKLKISEVEKQEIIGPEYAKWQSQTLTPIVKERDDLKKQVKDLSRKISDRDYESMEKSFFEHDEESLGEDKAKSLSANRKKFYEMHSEYKEKAADVEENHKDLEEAREVMELLKTKSIRETADSLGEIQLKQKAFADVMALFLPNVNDDMKKAIARLSTASNNDHYNDILKDIKGKSKDKDYKPANTRTRGTAGKLTHEIIKNMSPEEKERRNPEIIKFYETALK